MQNVAFYLWFPPYYFRIKPRFAKDLRLILLSKDETHYTKTFFYFAIDYSKIVS